MCPACSSFPRKQFYDDNGLKDSATIKKDNVHRQAMRQLSLNCGQDGVIVVCQAGLLAEVLKKNRGKHYNAVVNLISDAQERKCFHAGSTEDSHPDNVKRRAQLAAAILKKNTDDRHRESLRCIAEGRRHWENVRNQAALPAVPPYSGYRVHYGHTTRLISKSRIVKTADDFDEAKRAEAASIATAKVIAKNRRTLELATQA